MTTDNTLSFDDHINNVCKAAHFHIQALRHIGRCVSVDDAKTVATTTVSSRLDYCNSILHGTSSSNLNKLQRVQNTPNVHHHRDEKMRSHYTGVSQFALASYHCSHSAQNSTTDIPDTHDSSAKSHSLPTPTAPLVTTQVLPSQRG